MLKKMGIGLLVGLLLIGGITGVVLASEMAEEGDGPMHDLFDRLAERLGLSREDMLQELMDGKTLQEVMEDQGMTREELMDGRQIRVVRAPKPPFFDIEAIAGVLGMDVETLQAAFAEGKSLADVVADQGLDADDVLEDLISYAVDKIETAAEEGEITPEQAEKLLERLQNADFGTGWMDKVPARQTPMQNIRGRIQDSPAIILGDVAVALDMNPEALRDALKEGTSLAELIEEKGLEEQAVFADVKAALIARFEKVVEDKEKAVERAEQVLEKMGEDDFGTKMWEHMLEWQGPQDRGRMPEGGGLPWRAPRIRRP